jgi:hypothetical protein
VAVISRIPSSVGEFVLQTDIGVEMKKLILPCGASMDIEENRVEEALLLGHRLVGCAACNPRLRLTWFQRKFGKGLTGLERELSTARK